MTREELIAYLTSGARVGGETEASKLKQYLSTLKNTPELKQALEAGKNVKIGDLDIGPDIAGNKQRGGEAQAINQANKIYNQGLPKVQQTATAASEGLDTINDPKNIGSLGQARTLMLKTMGMNRYNENEAKAVLPPTLYGMATNLFNATGGEESPLTEAQRAVVNQFFKGQLSSAEQSHMMLKQNALNAASSSPYASDSTLARLSSLGSPMDNMFSQAKQKYSQLPQTQGPNLSSQAGSDPLSRLKEFFKPAGGKPEQLQKAPQQEMDPIAAELAKRAKQSLNQSQQQSPQQDNQQQGQ